MQLVGRVKLHGWPGSSLTHHGSRLLPFYALNE